MPALLPACDALPALVTACACSACHLRPSPQRPAPRPASCPCPWPGSRPYCQPQTRNPKAETGPISPPMDYACPGHQPQNIIHTVFASRGDPGRKHPPRTFSAPKIFYMKKSSGGHEFVLTWLARGLILNPKGSRLRQKPSELWLRNWGCHLERCKPGYEGTSMIQMNQKRPESQTPTTPVPSLTSRPSSTPARNSALSARPPWPGRPKCLDRNCREHFWAPVYPGWLSWQVLPGSGLSLNRVLSEMRISPFPIIFH